MTRVVAQVWARSNPDELIQISKSFAQPLQAIALEEALFSLGRIDRAEATKLLQDAHVKGIITMNFFDTFFWEWTQEDRFAAIQWILSDQELKAHERERVLRVIVDSIELSDFQNAVRRWTRFADRLHRSVEETEAELVRMLANTDIEAAISLIPRLRKESKLASISGVGRILVSSDQPKRALKLADLLMEEQRSDYYSSIFLQWSGNNYKHLLESIESLATNKLKTLAARALTQTHARLPVLSPAELEYVRTYLDEK